MSIQCDDREIRQLDLNNSHIADRIGAFLADAGLRLDEDLPYFVGMFDTEEHLVGCGGVDGNVIKCIAVATEVRGTGATAKLISHLVYAVFEAGQTNVRVFTKPEYKDLFKSLGFNLCGEGSTAVLLESDNRQLTKYCSYLALHPADGVIVANADPFTLGHLHLISYAAKQSQRLCVIVVGQNQKNTFAYADRLAMIGKTTKHLSNVEIVEGSDYIISNLSFPSYFLKRADNASRSQAEVDLDLFCRHLAPALGCIRRFVGSEPTDELTSQYNKQMKEMLPKRGIDVVEIERLADQSGPVSASRVRRALAEGRLKEALALVPASDTPYMLAHLAIKALRKELALSPKPGLVDRYDNGSHADMDFALMSRSIDSLQNYFTDVAVCAFENETIDNTSLRNMGIRAEERMLDVTGGVNTHRGAIFSMGITIAAAARILGRKSDRTLHDEIAILAQGLPRPAESHGQTVRKAFGISGALENAQTGYAMLFNSWLPFFQYTLKTDNDCLRLLMKIISELDDSNAIFRAGIQKANEARLKAARIANGDCDCNVQTLNELNEDFKRDHISHGGAADMLALTFFVDSISDAMI